MMDFSSRWCSSSSSRSDTAPRCTSTKRINVTVGCKRTRQRQIHYHHQNSTITTSLSSLLCNCIILIVLSSVRPCWNHNSNTKFASTLASSSSSSTTTATKFNHLHCASLSNNNRTFRKSYKSSNDPTIPCRWTRFVSNHSARRRRRREYRNPASFRTTSSSLNQYNSIFLHTVTIIRGGADFYDESMVSETAAATATTTEMDDNISNIGRSIVSWLFGDAFVQQGGNISGSLSIDLSNVTQSTNRGGALIKHKSTFRNPIYRSFIPSWIQQPFTSTLRLFSRDGTDDMLYDNNNSDDRSSISTMMMKTTTSTTQQITKIVSDSTKRWNRIWWVDDHDTSVLLMNDDDDDDDEEDDSINTDDNSTTKDKKNDDDELLLALDESSNVAGDTVTNKSQPQTEMDLEYYDIAITNKNGKKQQLGGAQRMESSNEQPLLEESTIQKNVTTNFVVNDKTQVANNKKVTSNVVVKEIQQNEVKDEAITTSKSNQYKNTTTTYIDNATTKATNNNNNYNDTTTAIGATNITTTPIIDSTTFTNYSESPYTSSGSWQTIDRALTFGYVNTHPTWRVSSRLRPIRKTVAHITGLHGLISGKPSSIKSTSNDTTSEFEDPKMGLIRRRLAAIERARQNIDRITSAQNSTNQRPFLFFRNKNNADELIDNVSQQDDIARQRIEKERIEIEKQRRRLKEIDLLIQSTQMKLLQLNCEKDVLQSRPNPLWNYTTVSEKIINVETDVGENETAATMSDRTIRNVTTRTFSFPPADLVDEYLEMLFITGRLIKMNHTDLWRQPNNDDDDEDVDELSSSSAFLPRKEQQLQQLNRRNNININTNNNNNAPWILRNIVGEKIGEATEMAAYKAVCKSLMEILAKAISNMHGINVMGYSDIRLYTEETPNLPPLSTNILMGGSGGNSKYRNRNYAHDAFRDAMRRGSTISTMKNRNRPPSSSFIQHDAIVETLTSQCQIAAPLLSLFPITVQRALISNIVTMSTSIITDFFEGLEFHILGHRLSFAFQPITEEDMIRNMVRDSYMNNNDHHHTEQKRRTNIENFENVVRNTADEVSMNLQIFDKWHERALGSGVLRQQIATMIARLVLTLISDILSSSRIDLWSSNAGGPKLCAALEYRSTG